MLADASAVVGCVSCRGPVVNAGKAGDVSPVTAPVLRRGVRDVPSGGLPNDW